jgi:hypothetical protein
MTPSVQASVTYCALGFEDTVSNAQVIECQMRSENAHEW